MARKKFKSKDLERSDQDEIDKSFDNIPPGKVHFEDDTSDEEKNMLICLGLASVNMDIPPNKLDNLDDLPNDE
ncbi:hypothetical protein JTB14_037230 [Gonioctena quinquepunctata]|nr:hypothetical protein JTB14_037230 [Gonioctena quinquepunctata]